VNSSTEAVAISAQPCAAAPPKDETTAQAVAKTMTAGRKVPASPSPHSTAMCSNQAALPEEYFQVAAEVQILGERLGDHNYEYWDAVARREYREDQDEVLSIPDEEFEKGYHEERTSITQRLDDAIKEADRLYAECRNRGIDVEANRMARRNDQDGSNDEARYQQTSGASLNLIPVEAFKSADVVRGATLESDQETSDVSNTNTAVNNCAENVPDE
jgi:hypothetical protein